MIMNNAGGDAPPTFLSIGDTIIAMAHIVTVDKRENGSVEILLTHDNEVLTLNDEDAQIFMQLFKEHAHVVTETVQEIPVLPFAREQDVHTYGRASPMHASVDLSQRVRPLIYISQDEIAQEFLQDVPLMAVVLYVTPRSSLSLDQFLATVPELKHIQSFSMYGALIAYSDVLLSSRVSLSTFSAELMGYIIKEWCKEQKDG